MAREGRFIGPGHAGVSVRIDSAGNTERVFTYHFHDGRDDGASKRHARRLNVE